MKKSITPINQPKSSLEDFAEKITAAIEEQFAENSQMMPQILSTIINNSTGNNPETTVQNNYSTYSRHEILDAIGPNSKLSLDISEKKYKGICLGIGGIKGIIEAGAIHEFWIRGQLRNLTHYAGSSAGSMIVFLLAIGYEPISILTVLCSPEFSSQFATINFMNLSSLYGLYPNNNIRKQLETLTMVKLGFLPTFADLKERMNKHMIIPIYCISEKELNKRKIYCSPDATPSMPIIEAIMLSSSMPIMFQKSVYEGKTYLDGGYTSAFPIREIERQMPSGSDILGIFLDHSEINTDSFFTYFGEIFLIPIREQDYTTNLAEHTDIMELTYSKTYSPFKFNLTPTQKMHMFSSGTMQIKNALKASRLYKKDEKEKAE